MKPITRSLLPALTLLICTSALAQYPNRPIRLVVPTTAGDGSDVLARLVERHLSDALGQPIVIENRPGAGGSIASAAGIKVE